MRDEETGRHRASKDRRKWCGGKPGREHAPKCVDYQETKRWRGGGDWLKGWKILMCTTCGKELDTYFPTRWGKSKPVPAWVTSENRSEGSDG